MLLRGFILQNLNNMKLATSFQAMPKGLDELPEHILSLVGQHLPVEDQLNYRLVSHVFNQNAKFYLKLHLDVKVMEQLTLHKLREIKMGLGPPSGALNSYTASQFDELSEATKSCVTNLTIHMMKTATNSMAELHTTLRRLRLSLPQPVDLTLVIWNQFRPFPISDNRETSGILTEFPQFTLRRLEWYWRPKIQPNDDRQADGRIVLKQLLTGCSKVTLLSYLKWSDLAGLGEFEHRLSHSLASLFMAVPPALPGEWLTRETSPTAFLAAQFPHLTELQMKVMRPIDLRPLVNLDSLKSLKIKFQADLMVTPLMFQTEFFSAPLLSVKNLLISLNRLNTETGLTQAIIQDIQHLFLMVPNVQRIRLKLVRRALLSTS